ncbi:MAG: SRPBCC family protein [Pseudomonas sp.]
MFKVIAIGLVCVIGAVLAFAATKPDTFRVQRTASIQAPPEEIFAQIIDLHGWSAWSPYEKKDPDMKRTFSGAATGKGAIYEWAGNSAVGVGRMEITEATVPSKITIKLDFIKPFEAHNTAEFILVAKGNATEVTWAMQGPTPFLAKIIHVFFNMDRMVGQDFETGLASLKTLAEK